MNWLPNPNLATIFEDPLAEFWLDCIKALALDAAFEALRRTVLAQAGADHLSTMNPVPVLPRCGR
jgi:hypothetical protein